MSSCISSLNVKTFSLNESSMNLTLLTTSLYTTDMSLPLSPFSLSLKICRRDLVDVPLYWNCSTNRTSWDRRDVTESLHYLFFHLSVFLDRNRYLIWLSDIIIYSLSWLVSLILFLLIFLSLFSRWFILWVRLFFIVYSLILYFCFYFLITSS